MTGCVEMYFNPHRLNLYINFEICNNYQTTSAPSTHYHSRSSRQNSLELMPGPTQAYKIGSSQGQNLRFHVKF